MKRNSSPFSPLKNSRNDDRVSVTHGLLKERAESRACRDSLWLSKKMVDDGCTLGQALQVMEERCKGCSVVSPMLCVEQCETWKVKKELRETTRILSEAHHGLDLLNAVKNKRRLTILDILWKGMLSFDDLQSRLRKMGFSYSQGTIGEYLKPLLQAGLVKENGNRFGLTLYGRKVHDAMIKHGFAGWLPIHSEGYEERILRSLLDGAKTRGELLEVAPAKSLSRTLRRLIERKLIVNDSVPDRVFYFRTKRALSMERLSPMQKRVCEAIPQGGNSARDLSRAAGVNLRRTYKYLRGLRGRKLVFRRDVPVKFELTERGRSVAEFLDEVAAIE